MIRLGLARPARGWRIASREAGGRFREILPARLDGGRQTPATGRLREPFEDIGPRSALIDAHHINRSRDCTAGRACPAGHHEPRFRGAHKIYVLGNVS